MKKIVGESALNEAGNYPENVDLKYYRYHDNNPWELSLNQLGEDC